MAFDFMEHEMSKRCRGCFAVCGSAMLLAAAAMVGGCAAGSATSEGESSALWVPRAQPSFTTIGRSAHFAIVRSESQDLLVIEDPVVDASGERVVGRLTWFVPIDPAAPVGQELAVPARESSASGGGWLVEHVSNRQTHAAPASGTVVIHARSDDEVLATVNMMSLGAEPTAGMTTRQQIRVDQTLGFARRVPSTPQYREMRTRSGVSTPK